MFACLMIHECCLYVMNYMMYMNECLNASAILFYVMLCYMHLVYIAICKGKKSKII